MQVGVVDESRTRALRRAVLRPHLTPDDPLPGDELSNGVHLAACADDATVLGTCFIYPDPCPWLPEVDAAWRLRQMATADGHRGQGIGATVLEAALGYVRNAGALILWCNARQSAAAFYARHGFHVHGEVFLEQTNGIPHLHMWRELAGAPTSSVRV
jgi:predicted GNAT family N-acyltransferase